GAAAVLLPGIPLVPVMWLSQVANGVLLPVVLILMIRLANNRRIMGNHVNSRLSNAVAWFTAIFVALATVALLASVFF
ncbi:MAG TPA: divalent metal cation transporter, partial [Anaerolineae bacterium]|nr:divalent metal cation transporter [Anaerolineae bacterium]